MPENPGNSQNPQIFTVTDVEISANSGIATPRRSGGKVATSQTSQTSYSNRTATEIDIPYGAKNADHTTTEAEIVSPTEW